MKKYRNDILLGAGVLLLAAAAYFIYLAGAGGGGGFLEAAVDGEIYGTYSLDKDQSIEISTSYGKNVLVINGGSACITEADCPDRICVKQGRISKKGQTIICLPHRLVVTVVQGEEGEVDAVAGK